MELCVLNAESSVKKRELFKALEYYHQALEKGISSPDIHQQMSVLYYHLGFLDKAIGATQKALKSVPENDYLHHNLGVLYFANSNLPKAREHFIKALKINPGSSHSHYYLAHLFLRQNFPELANFFAHSAKQLGHPASDLWDLSNNRSPSPPLTVWV
ncbi:MAG: tetratricopeptide repeat protein, partial [Thermodesulfobacteriota bacterium]|nr:tetratricopeptide repeat protein [Thermodesulfobacteriota bacterium]